jgi:hypothetical protein
MIVVEHMDLSFALLLFPFAELLVTLPFEVSDEITYGISGPQLPFATDCGVISETSDRGSSLTINNSNSSCNLRHSMSDTSVWSLLIYDSSKEFDPAFQTVITPSLETVIGEPFSRSLPNRYYPLFAFNLF